MPRRNNSPKHIPFTYQNPEQQKRRFRSKQAAEAAADRIMLERPRVTLYVYQSPHDKGWYLTSTKLFDEA